MKENIPGEIQDLMESLKLKTIEEQEKCDYDGIINDVIIIGANAIKQIREYILDGKSKPFMANSTTEDKKIEI